MGGYPRSGPEEQEASAGGPCSFSLELFNLNLQYLPFPWFTLCFSRLGEASRFSGETVLLTWLHSERHFQSGEEALGGHGVL